MIDSIDVMNILETIIQPNIKMITIIIIIIILSARYLETNIIFIISITIYIFIYYKQINETLREIKKDENKIERVIEDNRRYKKEIHFSDELNKYLHKLKKYRKYNPQSYDEGYKYIKMFMYTIHDLEKDNISHSFEIYKRTKM